MKAILCAFALAVTASPFASGAEFLISQVFLSPTKKDLIIIDYYNTEGGASPEKATLYALPLDDRPGRPILPALHYEWSPDGQYFGLMALNCGLPPRDETEPSMGCRLG